MVDAQVALGRGERIAVIEADGQERQVSYSALAARIDRVARVLLGLGLEPEQRVLLCLLDTIDFPSAFLGAMKLGAVPIPVNTMLTTADYDYMLRDSRARVLVVSGAVWEKFAPILAGQEFLRKIVVVDPPASLDLAANRAQDLAALLGAASADAFSAFPASNDDVAFWLYSSGSTGKPKGAVHLHAHIPRTAELFAHGVLKMDEKDVVFSASKLYFAYGLGNGLSFVFSSGATAVLLSARPTPAAVLEVLAKHDPTLFFGVPTLYASILADPAAQKRPGQKLRACVSAGEALPRDLEAKWQDQLGVHIVDGLGSTEMLHIFLSDGQPVPGYELMLVDDTDHPVPRGEIGELKVSGPTSATHYWNQREKSRHTFRGPWTLTGDKYVQREDGSYVYCGRSDDMIKVGGIWVSPAEVEAAITAHAAVLEAAVVGAPDENGLLRTKAFVVLKAAASSNEAFVEELRLFVRGKLAAYKCPRVIELRDTLPKTATGKIQRFKLRE